MRIVRFGVFETNSSSTHSMIIMSKEEKSKWKNGELFRCRYGDRFIEKKDADKIIQSLKEQYAKNYKVDISEIEIEDVKYEDSFYEDFPLTFDEYDDWMNLEMDENYYVTKNGEEIVIMCWYGNDY